MTPFIPTPSIILKRYLLAPLSEALHPRNSQYAVKIKNKVFVRLKFIIFFSILLIIQLVSLYVLNSPNISLRHPSICWPDLSEKVGLIIEVDIIVD